MLGKDSSYKPSPQPATDPIDNPYNLFSLARKEDNSRGMANFEPKNMKYLIVGLGNIGEEYWGTRHNVGFRMANAIAEEIGATFTEQRYGAIARGRIKNAELVLLKPSTYMNLSGEAVRYWLQKENLPTEQLLILVDDLALDFGTLRLKSKGSDAGHNGLKNIAQLLGTAEYARLRFGLGSRFSRGRQIEFVLGHFTPEEEQYMPLLTKEAVAIVRDFCLSGVDRAMNWHNKKSLLPPPEEPKPDSPTPLPNY